MEAKAYRKVRLSLWIAAASFGVGVVAPCTPAWAAPAKGEKAKETRETRDPKTIKDNATGVTIKAGPQTLDGAQALAFVRTRKSAATPRSDLDRVANQRIFIGALASEIASPATLLNPFALFPLLSEVPNALTVDEGDHLYHLAGLGFAMGGISDGGTITTTVPVTDGSATQMDEVKSQALFDALKTDAAVPKDALYD